MPPEFTNPGQAAVHMKRSSTSTLIVDPGRYIEVILYRPRKVCEYMNKLQFA